MRESEPVSREVRREVPAAGVVLGRLEDFPLGRARLARAAGRRLAVVRHEDGVLVVDNACPHQGYALVRGEVADGCLSCEWHNWKYRLTDGACVRGEEDLRPYPVEVVAGEVRVHLSAPAPEALRPRLLASLRRALEDGYAGQIARDVVRLLRAEADPVQLVWEAVAWGAPRGEFGFGHSMASLVDCLALAGEASGDARALPVVQAFVGVAETERRRPLRPQPDPCRTLPPRPGEAFRRALEAEALGEAEALLRGAIAAGTAPAVLEGWLVGALGQHHLGYGHGAIYVQKAFQLLERLGSDRADTVLPHLVPALGTATREDKLPYMRPFLRGLAGVRLESLAEAAANDREVPLPERDTLRAALLGRDGSAIGPAAVALAAAGGGLESVLDVVVEVASQRMLRYDPGVELAEPPVDFGWLDLTHALTYAAAARWALRRHRNPDSARLVLFAAFLAHYGGRRGYREVASEPEASGESSPTRSRSGGAPITELATCSEVASPERLATAALGDGAGSFIMAAHAVKTSRAAILEAVETGSPLPRAAAWRFLSSPRRERFVGLEVANALRLADGRPPL